MYNSQLGSVKILSPIHKFIRSIILMDVNYEIVLNENVQLSLSNGEHSKIITLNYQWTNRLMGFQKLIILNIKLVNEIRAAAFSYACVLRGLINLVNKVKKYFFAINNVNR